MTDASTARPRPTSRARGRCRASTTRRPTSSPRSASASSRGRGTASDARARSRRRATTSLRTIAGESLIILRDRSGELRAFFNVCRHRGTRLCEAASGHFSETIQCPYHAWTYTTDGRLIGAPHMQEVEGFDKRDYPLHSAALAEWEGFVFVNVATEPEPFDDVVRADDRPPNAVRARRRSTVGHTRHATRCTRTGSSSSRTTPSACTAR